MLLGMNPAIRAVVRMGLYAGAKVFAIWEVFENNTNKQQKFYSLPKQYNKKEFYCII
jgi:6-phosphofructokinase